MSNTGRRTFLQGAGLGAAAWALGTGAAHSAAERRLIVGVIGPGGMGTAHLRQLLKDKDVEVAYVCDPDQKRLAAATKLVETGAKKAPKAVSDMRQPLDDRRVAAVFIATPDHWHAPAAILALDAGKHVYVEKPCCHNIREGRLMAETVKRSGKLLQVGTQSRSTACVREAMDRVCGGEIGDILVAKVWNSQLRRSIGKTKPSQPPADLDFHLWVGPAPTVPYRSNLLPGIWRWWYDFGCGDIGNDGVHDIDVACWGLGLTTHPSRVSCLGGKYFFDDDQQFPDTQYAVFEYPTRAWIEGGVWEEIRAALRLEVREQAGRDPSPPTAALDSQSVKTTEQGGEARGYDGGKKVSGRKRHVVVDSTGMLLAVLVTAASVDDATAAKEVLALVESEPFTRLETIYADNKYHNHDRYAWVEGNAIYRLHIVPRPEGAVGFVKLPQRWVVERTFAWLGRSRRLSKDYEKLTSTSAARVQISRIHLMLKRLDADESAPGFPYRASNKRAA